MLIKCLISILLINNVELQEDTQENVQNNFERMKGREISDLKDNVLKIISKLNENLWEQEQNGTDVTGRKLKGFKHMRTHMAPLIFKMGAASTWMLLTAFLAAKSVAIGLLLLVLKIVLNSAKLASLFSLLKHKHHLKSESQWSWKPPHPGHDYHPGHGHYDTHDHPSHGYGHPSHDAPVLYEQDFPPFRLHDHDRTSTTSILDGPRIDTSAWQPQEYVPTAPEWTGDEDL